MYTMLKKKNEKNMMEYDKRKSHISSKIHVIYIFYNNVTVFNSKCATGMSGGLCCSSAVLQC